MSTWTTITDARIDADSPIDEDLMTDLRENAEYNYERAIRAGTHTTGVRLAFARGTVAFSDATPSDPQVFTGSVVFATDADDGDPNFPSAPIVTLTLEENDSSGQQWSTGIMWCVAVEGGTLTADGFDYLINITGLAASPSQVHGILHWTAFAPVSTGE